jgi:hypothetical protein
VAVVVQLKVVQVATAVQVVVVLDMLEARLVELAHLDKVIMVALVVLEHMQAAVAEQARLAQVLAAQ